jgi:hypothetical protein
VEHDGNPVRRFTAQSRPDSLVTVHGNVPAALFTNGLGFRFSPARFAEKVPQIPDPPDGNDEGDAEEQDSGDRKQDGPE